MEDHDLWHSTELELPIRKLSHWLVLENTQRPHDALSPPSPVTFLLQYPSKCRRGGPIWPIDTPPGRMDNAPRGPPNRPPRPEGPEPLSGARARSFGSADRLGRGPSAPRPSRSGRAFRAPLPGVFRFGGGGARWTLRAEGTRFSNRRPRPGFPAFHWDRPYAPGPASPPLVNASGRDLLGLPRAKLKAVLAPWMDRPFRAEQVFEAIHLQGILDFAAMTTLPTHLREVLAQNFSLSLPRCQSRHMASDGTTKYLLELSDGRVIEAVDIPERDRRTFCISSQAGCALGCRFCVTGFWGADRNLTAGEIVGQVLKLEREGRVEQPPNLVFMGMGEPLLNPEAVQDAIEILSERISVRRMTLSTAGHLPGLEAMSCWPKRPNLAVSLHAPDDERRSALMPINRVYPIRDLLAVLKRFPLEPRRRITIEYLLLAGFNDALADADLLAQRLRPLRAKINLIPFNPDPVLPSWMSPPEPQHVEAFRRRLEERGFAATIRRRRGHEVQAACGQLRASDRLPRGFRGPVDGLHQAHVSLRPHPNPSRRKLESHAG